MIYGSWSTSSRSSILCSFCQHHKIIRMYQRPQFWRVPKSRRGGRLVAVPIPFLWSSTEAATNNSITVAAAVKNQEAGCQYQYNVGIGIGSGWYLIQATTPLWAHPHWKDGRYGIECGNGEDISRRLWSQGLFLIPTIFTKQTNESGRKANISSIRYNWKDLVVTKSVRNYNRHRVPYEIMDELGYEDCDWVSSEWCWTVWKERFESWHFRLELHLPCRDPIEHLLSRCNHRNQIFDCGNETKQSL